MHTLHIRVEESFYDKVRLLLNNLPKDAVQVLSDNKSTESSLTAASSNVGKDFVEKWSGMISEEPAEHSRTDYLEEKYK